MLSKIQDWLDERLQAGDRIRYIIYKPVPLYGTRFWYCFGGLALVTFLVQLISGILIAFYYVPSTDRAYQSVWYLTNIVKYGWVVRSLHYWGAQFMVIFVVVHMLRVFYTKSYAKPRELTWVTGTVQLMLVFAFAFTGYLLPWHDTAYWGTAVALSALNEVPFIGADVKAYLMGGENPNPSTLSHFFAIHAAVLPLLLISSLIFHFWMIRRQGISEPL